MGTTISMGGGGWAGAVVKADCLESRRSRARNPLWHSNFKETKCSGVAWCVSGITTIDLELPLWSLNNV